MLGDGDDLRAAVVVSPRAPLCCCRVCVSVDTVKPGKTTKALPGFGMDQAEIISNLQEFGADEEDILSLREPLGPQHIEHLDLHPSGRGRGSPLGVDVVLRPEGRGLLYVVPGCPEPSRQDDIADRLAQRGEGEFVGFLLPGLLTVVPTARRHRSHRATHSVTSGQALGVIPGLTFGTSDLTVDGADAVLHRELLTLFNESVDELVRSKVSPADALSFVGRAMFFRFLMDRGFIRDEQAAAISDGARSLSAAMETARAAGATLRWLDATFNGHLLPLSPAAFERVVSPKRGDAVREQLTRILARTNARGQLAFSWGQLDFSHIPVGLLSEVYEDWAHTYDDARARREGAWYTPAAIANGIVREAIGAMSDPWRAHVLDPSAGAGVFLVAAYRRLVEATWEHDGRRPDRATVRAILLEQLVGMEVNEAALRLSALALYLTALDLDPEPSPAACVRFPNLLDRGVLRDVRSTRTRKSHDDPQDDDHARIERGEAPVGSLGRHVDRALEGRFHIVVGNPPWTSWKVSEPAARLAAKEVEEVVAPIVKARLADTAGSGYAMSGGNPDLPFVWRAAEWAVRDGVLAFVLHGRWLFQQTEQAVARRAEVLRGLSVTTLINGSALRRKKGVWPGQEAPFLILFARNRRPVEGEWFRFLSPVEDDRLNARGRIRLDAAAAFPMSPEDPIERPWLFKTLSRGGPLDRTVVERVLTASQKKTLADWWPEDFSGRGYENAAHRGASAINMRGRADLGADEEVRAILDGDRLPRFTRTEVRRPSFATWRREHPDEVHAGLAPRMFRGPLLIVRKVPKIDGEVSRGLATWTSQDVVYSQSFLGLSAAWHPNANAVSRYLFVWLNSSVLRHYLLMCSADWGVERGTLLVDDLRSLPVPHPESLSEAQRAAFDECAAEMIATDHVDVERCDGLVAEVFGLSGADLECVRDTLAMSEPGRDSARAAQEAPPAVVVEAFRARLEEILAPLLKYSGRTLRVRIAEQEAVSPWRVLLFCTRGDGGAPPRELVDGALALATREGASRVVFVGGVRTATVAVGVFRQQRYWTLTQARSLALHLLGDVAVMDTLRGATK